MTIIILGGGIAGTTCAEEARKLLPDAEITILSEEPPPLYSRVLLGHYLKGQIERERIFLKKMAWSEEQKIQIFDVRAEKNDVKNKFVATSDGRELPFDKLVIATGRYTRDLPEDQRGVSYLWTLDDAEHLSQLISEQSRPCPVAIYGGGLIAGEYLNIFKHFNFDITIAFRGTKFLSKNLDEKSSQLIVDHLKKQNIKVVPEADFVRLEGEKELEKFVTSQGEISCKILGVGIGLDPDFSVFENSGLKINKGIVVNEKMETNLPDVYAIGDIIEAPDFYSGRTRMFGSWFAAQTQGRVAGQNLAGQNSVFKQITSTSMNFAGLDVIIIGDTDHDWADEIKLDENSDGVVQRFFKNKKLIGATLVNRNGERKGVMEEFEVKT